MRLEVLENNLKYIAPLPEFIEEVKKLNCKQKEFNFDLGNEAYEAKDLLRGVMYDYNNRYWSYTQEDNFYLMERGLNMIMNYNLKFKTLPEERKGDYSRALTKLIKIAKSLIIETKEHIYTKNQLNTFK